MTAGSTSDAPVAPLVEHTFRQEYARLVTRLARRYGYHRTELAEDAVQAALAAALHTWPRCGAPANPSAWLHHVARNKLIDRLRGPGDINSHLQLDADCIAGDLPAVEAIARPEDHFFPHEVADDQLRMLFVCADEAIPFDSQLVLALKVLCGFSTREIALRLLTSEGNVQKRLTRARERLREIGPSLETPPLSALHARRQSVLHMIYLLFNEGYSSAQPDRLIRHELCDEAIRLALLLAQHPGCTSPEGDALLALMYLHKARFDARLDGSGGVLLLEEQDRTKWDRQLIRLGASWLARAGRGIEFSRYHAEAAVALEHCLASSFATTNWREIVELYELLERREPSPLRTLNRAIAIAEWQGPKAGLAVLHALRPPAWLSGYYLWDATLGELERRAGNSRRARMHLLRALDAAPHPAERQLLARRLAACETQPGTTDEGGVRNGK